MKKLTRHRADDFVKFVSDLYYFDLSSLCSGGWCCLLRLHEERQERGARAPRVLLGQEEERIKKIKWTRRVPFFFERCE